MKNQLFIICFAALICGFLIALDGNRAEKKESTEKKSNDELLPAGKEVDYYKINIYYDNKLISSCESLTKPDMSNRSNSINSVVTKFESSGYSRYRLINEEIIEIITIYKEKKEND